MASTKFVVRLGNRYLNNGRLVAGLRVAQVFDSNQDGIILECAPRLSLQCVRVERSEHIIVHIRTLDDESTPLERKIKRIRDEVRIARNESELESVVRAIVYND